MEAGAVRDLALAAGGKSGLIRSRMTTCTRLAALGALLPALLVAAPKPTDSAHYQTVRDRVGEAGQVFVYVDVDGYVTELGRDLTTSLATAAGDDANLAQWKQDYAAIGAELGLSQVKAVGLSAHQLGDGLFANRIFLYAPEGRRGLLQVFGGGAHPFASARLAPTDADLFVETELDLAALTDTSLQLCKRISPELAAQFPVAMPTGAGADALGALFSLSRFKGRFTAIVRLHPEESSGLDFSFKHDVLCATDVLGPQLLSLLQTRYPDLKAGKTEGGRTFYSRGEKAGGLSASVTLAVEGERLYVASSAAFLRECLERKAGLVQAPVFAQALAATAKEGNTVVYATPRLFAQAKELLSDLPSKHPRDRMAAAGMHQVFQRFDRVKTPVVSVVTNLSDGVLVQSVSPESLREALPLFGLATPDLAGNFLRVALPSYVADRYARGAAERRTVLVEANLGRLSAAAERYFARNPENTEVSFAQLQEFDAEATKLTAALDEDYTTVSIRRDRDAVEVETPENGTVKFGRPLTADERSRIEHNLAAYDEAAVLFFAAKPDETSMTGYAAAGAGCLASQPTAVVGEDYDNLELERDTSTIEVRTPGGTNVTYTRVPGLRWTVLKRRAQQTATIRENLAIAYQLGTEYLRDHPDESYVTGSELFGEGKDRPELRSVAGETYGDVRMTRTRAGNSVTTPTLGEIVYEAPVASQAVTAIQANLRSLAKAAKGYFAKHPQEKFVVVGELLDAEKAAPARPEAAAGEDYLPLVIERDAPTLTIALPTGQKVSVELP